ncbi:ATP-binding protein [Luteibacter sp. 9135]|uniref:ATP-binding protein n=1 Tax=Luteibacter sp. 9135 TaxID=1500893 RepID=UPI000566567E|nr:ATP-binding protein [Luteibacter sp. 9135]
MAGNGSKDKTAAHRPAGGRATEAGMAFQAAVGTWLAAHLLAKVPVGGRFGTDNEVVSVSIRLETGEGLDDIEVVQSNGGILSIQSKTNANLGSGPKAPLTKTVGQLARWIAEAKKAGPLPDPTHNAAIFAVSDKAASTLNDLESGCRAMDMGGSFRLVSLQRNQAERAALSVFETLATPAWTAHTGAAPSDADLTSLARLFRVRRFAMNEGEVDWREASQLIGRRLYGDETKGDSPLRDLLDIVRKLIGSGAPADRTGLIRELRRRGHTDIGSPRFDADVSKLLKATRTELTRLAAHACLPLNGGLPVRRAADNVLIGAIRAGSLLVIGEPGCGKTGALWHAASELAQSGASVVFLSVDRYPGVALSGDLASELELEHPLFDVLAAWPGVGPKILFIDALDAARGGPPEAVFGTLIDRVIGQTCNEWAVVASIRTFDLKNGHRFREAFPGAPVEPAHAELGLERVRHFRVPTFSDSDLDAVGALAPTLGALLGATSPKVKALLRNAFNLSLAAGLVGEGMTPDAFAGVRSQSGLIDLYENARLKTMALKRAVGAAAATMVKRHRLTVRKVDVDHDSLDDVIASGVLVGDGDLVSFAHHVLFDHAVGRYYLDWTDGGALLVQLQGETSVALRLAPAVTFAVDRMWRMDENGPAAVWNMLLAAFSSTTVDAVASNVAIRVAVESVSSESDILALRGILDRQPHSSHLPLFFQRLAGCVGVDVSGKIAGDKACVWASLAHTLMVNGAPMVEPARHLLFSLFERAPVDEPVLRAVFATAARTLLALAWSEEPVRRNLVSVAIRFVGRSAEADPEAAVALLDRVLREPHFSRFADAEAGWLAEQIVPVTRASPAFTLEVYTVLFGHRILDDSSSWIGGQQSRILPLSSNRKQDYGLVLWQLGSALAKVLTISPTSGTRAVIAAQLGKAITSGLSITPTTIRMDDNGTVLELRGRSYPAFQLRNGGARHAHDDDPLHQYSLFLKGCTVEAFAASVAAASVDYATPGVWERIFTVAVTRVDVADLVWPFALRCDFFSLDETAFAAARFVAATWLTRGVGDRRAFEENVLLATPGSGVHEAARWASVQAAILSCIGVETLQTASRAVRDDLAVRGLLANGAPGGRHEDPADEGSDPRRMMLVRLSIDRDEGDNAAVHAASEALSARLTESAGDDGQIDLASLWLSAHALADQASTLDVHDEVRNIAFSAVFDVVERMTGSDGYNPGVDGLPSLTDLLGLMDRIAPPPSQTPGPSGERP